MLLYIYVTFYRKRSDCQILWRQTFLKVLLFLNNVTWPWIFPRYKHPMFHSKIYIRPRKKIIFLWYFVRKNFLQLKDIIFCRSKDFCRSKENLSIAVVACIGHMREIKAFPVLLVKLHRNCVPDYRSMDYTFGFSLYCTIFRFYNGSG